MNANFLKKVFSIYRFYRDYKKFLSKSFVIQKPFRMSFWRITGRRLQVWTRLSNNVWIQKISNLWKTSRGCPGLRISWWNWKNLQLSCSTIHLSARKERWSRCKSKGLFRMKENTPSKWIYQWIMRKYIRDRLTLWTTTMRTKTLSIAILSRTRKRKKRERSRRRKVW